MESDFEGPVNIGSEEMAIINQLVEMAISIAGKKGEDLRLDLRAGGDGAYGAGGVVETDAENACTHRRRAAT
jgi:hypothetical protein